MKLYPVLGAKVKAARSAALQNASVGGGFLSARRWRFEDGLCARGAPGTSRAALGRNIRARVGRFGNVKVISIQLCARTLILFHGGGLWLMGLGPRFRLGWLVGRKGRM